MGGGGEKGEFFYPLDIERQCVRSLGCVFLDGQLLILRQLRCHQYVSEFFYSVEFNRAKKPTLKAALEGNLNLSSDFHSSRFQN